MSPHLAAKRIFSLRKLLMPTLLLLRSAAPLYCMPCLHVCPIPVGPSSMKEAGLLTFRCRLATYSILHAALEHLARLRTRTDARRGCVCEGAGQVLGDLGLLQGLLLLRLECSLHSAPRALQTSITPWKSYQASRQSTFTQTMYHTACLSRRNVSKQWEQNLAHPLQWQQPCAELSPCSLPCLFLAN